MSGYGDLPEGWQVWTEDADGGDILVYRPDVFDSHEYPSPCLPTIQVAQRPPTQQKRRAGSNPDGWWVSLTLEPEVRVRDADARFDSRTAAVAGAVDLAERFAAGDVDYRGAYQIPREDYLDELDDRTGREA
ncbi:DUF5820 family protein [Halobacterium jilantaiense]|uniref:Uncharacterized protein n=1 Tax=Halobacterium jilantaiense TaxID=355548 RepID=A0A1I0MEW6_9EURY|nr:DUF5820 family protein [Halobacterium jilantaiense]SEV86923.1 hypothetical protein SAMN04487945_0011 [Halobacterium jilantaiense]